MRSLLRTKDSDKRIRTEQRSIWSSPESKVIAAMEDYLDKCIDIEVEIAVLELLLEPEEAQICLRYIPKHEKRRGSNVFEIFDTKEKDVASRRRWLEYQGERVALQERWQNDWQDMKYEVNGRGSRKIDVNALAAAKLFFKLGGRKPVELCGR